MGGGLSVGSTHPKSVDMWVIYVYIHICIRQLAVHGASIARCLGLRPDGRKSKPPPGSEREMV